MSSFWGSSIIGDVQNPSPARDSSQENSRCPDFIGFLAVCFTGGASAQLGLHPVLTDTNPKFEDVSMGGASFDVRKARSKSFPYGLNDQLFAGREFVVVKHPRVDSGSVHARGLFSEIATELQILRHPPLMKHENIVDFLTVVYHDAGELGDSKILPALVIEYAEFGSLNSYQASGYGRSVEDKIDIVTDVARGLEALHDSGIIHGDVKTSNMLVCKHPKRKFIVKLTDFGFSLSVDDDRLVGLTKKLEAPEASGTIEQRYLRQLDIYSYGLLLYTVFKNGALFYEGIPEEDRDSHVMKLKTTGLLAITTQINLLLNMSNEPCTLFLICKILAYALQPSPGRRFRSMSTIVNLLDFSKLPDDVYGKTFSNNSGQQQEQSGNAELSVEVFLPLQQNMSKTLKERVEEYCVSFSNDESPLLKVLKMELFKRVDYEISVFYGSIQAGSNTVTISAGRTDVLLKDSRGLLPESQLADCPMPANGASYVSWQRNLEECVC